MAGIMDGKVVVITGAGSGMGLSAARLFHAEGALLVLGGRSGNERDTAEELGDRAVAIHADVRKADQVQKMIDCAIKTYGGLDVLLNVAGAAGAKVALADTSEETFDSMVDTNLRGVFLGMKYAIPHMLRRRKGAIVNVASTAALIGTPQLGVLRRFKSGCRRADESCCRRIRQAWHTVQRHMPRAHQHSHDGCWRRREPRDGRISSRTRPDGTHRRA